MAGAITIEQFGLGDSRIREFAEFPWRLYRNDPCWTPPLMADLLGSRVLGTKGLLTPEHPYHRFAEVTHFIARLDGIAAGTISAAVNHRYNEYHGTPIGFFGFFECIDDQAVANALLDAARAWIAERDLCVMRGPGQYSNATHEIQGVLVEGFEYPPTVELTHNPPYYDRLLTTWGARKSMDYVAYTLAVRQPISPRLRELAEKVAERRHITTRPVDMSRFEAELRLLVGIYNDAWAENWGFLPVTDEEADILAESLRPIIDPQLVRFAYVDGEAAAVLGALPDPNWALRPRWKWYGDSDAVRIARLLEMRGRIPRVRLMFFGIRKQYRRLGIDALLFAQMLEYAQTKHYLECETSMLLEHNDLVIRASAFMGGREYKRWRIYDRVL
jgi:GNAT superfamily N-acetyltransferase